MNKRTYERYQKLHKELWLWLSKNPEKNKSAWTKWPIIDSEFGIIVNSCFACDTVEQILYWPSEQSCYCCPIIWEKKRKRKFKCYVLPELYGKWIKSTTSLILRTKLAKEIANLPWIPWEEYKQLIKKEDK